MENLVLREESKTLKARMQEESNTLRNLQRKRDLAKTMVDFVEAQAQLDEFFGLPTMAPPVSEMQEA